MERDKRNKKREKETVGKIIFDTEYSLSNSKL